MNKTSSVHPTDLLGFSRLAIDGTVRLADLIEAMHHTITGAPGILGTPDLGKIRSAGITDLRYGNHPVPYAFQRRSMVRRAEEDESAQTVRPPMARCPAVVIGTTGNEAAA